MWGPAPLTTKLLTGPNILKCLNIAGCMSFHVSGNVVNRFKLHKGYIHSRKVSSVYTFIYLFIYCFYLNYLYFSFWMIYYNVTKKSMDFHALFTMHNIVSLILFHNLTFIFLHTETHYNLVFCDVHSAQTTTNMEFSSVNVLFISL